MLRRGQVQAPVVLPHQAPDLDKNMLREALLGRVNEEGGSGSLLHSNSVQRAAGGGEK